MNVSVRLLPLKFSVDDDTYMGTDKTPEERAKILESTPLFANIHASAASAGQTAVPDDLDTNLHFTCFVQAPGMRLIELDGRRTGPVDRGECDDLLRVRPELS